MSSTKPGILLDLDGTLYFKGAWIEGAAETVQKLIREGYPLRFITNTTMKSSSQLMARFVEQGLDVEPSWFFTPARAARQWLSKQPLEKGVLALVAKDLHEDLQGLPLVTGASASVVLVGDMAKEWRVESLHLALRALKRGARLMALQQNRFWLSPEGEELDVGAFVAALEYASEERCERTFGKPSNVFFNMVIEDIGCAPKDSFMVGDDIRSDVLAAQANELRGVLVKTGKGADAPQDKLKQADYVLDSVAGIFTIL